MIRENKYQRGWGKFTYEPRYYDGSGWAFVKPFGINHIVLIRDKKSRYYGMTYPQ